MKRSTTSLTLRISVLLFTLVMAFAFINKREQIKATNKSKYRFARSTTDGKGLNSNNNDTLSNGKFRNKVGFPGLKTTNNFIHPQHIYSEYCYLLSDLSARPHPLNDRSNYFMFRQEFPFVQFTSEAIREILTDTDAINWHFNSVNRRIDDLSKSKNKESWDYLDDLKNKSVSLKLGDKVTKVIEILGIPSRAISYSIEMNLDGIILKNTKMIDITEGDINEVHGPITLRYEPPEWTNIRYSPLRILIVDFNKSKELVQWYFEPVPLTGDW